MNIDEHVREILIEAERLGFTAHENSWKQLKLFIEAALTNQARDLQESRRKHGIS